ncbi:MAG: TOBE domain-containing protein, partial [Polyangiaceae bacterium]
AKLRVEMRAEIKQLHMSLNATTVYVTHDQEEAMTLGDRVVVMKDGVIQQCGAPLDVYHRPQNRFVAGFVGTPAMNFFEGTIARENNQLWFDEGSGRLAVPAWAKEGLGEKVGTKVVMGVRPQAISDRPIGAAGMKDNILTMKVSVIEPLGDKMDVYLSTPSHARVVAHIDAHRGLTPNETRPMYVDLERIHFFETGDEGRQLTTAPAAA